MADVKTWEQRAQEYVSANGIPDAPTAFGFAEAEIAELRAALQAQQRETGIGYGVQKVMSEHNPLMGELRERAENVEAEVVALYDRLREEGNRLAAMTERAEKAEAALERLDSWSAAGLEPKVPGHLHGTPNGNHYRNGYLDALYDVRQGMQAILDANPKDPTERGDHA